jgi:hypothetical protein
MSGTVDGEISDSGIVEKVRIATEVSFVVVARVQAYCIYADFKVFPVFRQPYWISGMRQIWPEGAIL